MTQLSLTRLDVFLLLRPDDYRFVLADLIEKAEPCQRGEGKKDCPKRFYGVDSGHTSVIIKTAYIGWPFPDILAP